MPGTGAFLMAKGRTSKEFGGFDRAVQAVGDRQPTSAMRQCR